MFWCPKKVNCKVPPDFLKSFSDTFVFLSPSCPFSLPFLLFPSLPFSLPSSLPSSHFSLPSSLFPFPRLFYLLSFPSLVPPFLFPFPFPFSFSPSLTPFSFFLYFFPPNPMKAHIFVPVGVKQKNIHPCISWIHFIYKLHSICKLLWAMICRELPTK